MCVNAWKGCFLFEIVIQCLFKCYKDCFGLGEIMEFIFDLNCELNFRLEGVFIFL